MRRTYFDGQVGSIGQSLYEDGKWHTTATVPSGVNLMQFDDVEKALEIARVDATQKGLKELSHVDQSLHSSSAQTNHNVGVRRVFQPFA